MSEKIPVWSWRNAIQKAKVQPGTKLVCYEVSNWISDAGKGWRIPSKVIQDNTGLSNRSVATHLARAAEAKLLKIVRELGPNGQRGVTRYVPCFPPEMDLAREADLSDLPSEETSPGQPREEASLRTPQPREDTSLSHVKNLHDKYLSTSKKVSTREEALQEGAAQARPLPQVETIEVPQPKPKKPKADKVDLLGEQVPKRTRSTKVPFPDQPHPDLLEEWLAFGRGLDLTEEEVQMGLINCKLHHVGEGNRKADWTPVVQKWLLGDRNRKRKQANGARRAPASTDDAFAMAEAMARGPVNRYGQVAF